MDKKGVLEVSAVEVAGGEHDHRRIDDAGRCHRAQGAQQNLRVVIHRRHRVLREQLREQLHHRFPVLQHVGNPGRHPCVILENVEVVGGNADDIDAGDVHVDLPRQVEAEHLRTEAGIVQHQCRRDAAGLEDMLLVVDVIEEGVDGAHALADACPHRLPLLGIEDARDDVEGNQPLDPLLAAVDGEGDPQPAEDQVGLLMLFQQPGMGCRIQPFLIGAVGFAHAVTQAVHLVERITEFHGFQADPRSFRWALQSKPRASGVLILANPYRESKAQTRRSH